MAALSSEVLRCSNKLASLTEDFEAVVKTRMSWTKLQWEEDCEQDFRLKKLVNSLRFWNKKLAKAQGDRNIIITVFNSDKDMFVELHEIFDAIWAIDSDIEIMGFANFRNPRYVSITFRNETQRDIVRDKLRNVAGHNVAFLDWAHENKEHHIKVLWLSDNTDIKHSKVFLEEFFDITEQNRLSMKLKNGKSVPTGTVTFKGKLKKDVVLTLVPHLAFIDDLECLINISGRKCLCLCCEGLGHRARDCPTPFCSSCQKLSPRKHVCVEKQEKALTYADKVRGDSVKDLSEHLKDFSSGVLVTKGNPTESTTQKAVCLVEVKVSEGKKDLEDVNNDLVKVELAGGSLADKFECSSNSEADSEIEDVGEGGEMLTKMQSYFSELENLKAPVEVKENVVGSQEGGNNEFALGEGKMECSQSSLKRKSEAPLGQHGAVRESEANRKTYGRKARLTGQEKNDKKWNKLMALSEAGLDFGQQPEFKR